MAESTLTLEVAGRTYEVPSPPARVGLAIQATALIVQTRARNRVAARTGGQQVSPPGYALEWAKHYDDLSTTVEQDALGPAWEQMIEDGVSLAELERAGEAAYLWVVRSDVDQEQAQRIFAVGAVQYFAEGGATGGPKA